MKGEHFLSCVESSARGLRRQGHLKSSRLLLYLLFGLQTSALAQGTAFTYQGRLNDGANPANGNYDLTFALFTVSAGGSPLAGPLTNSANTVSNGLFTVTLDFGAGLFTGPDRYLEIAVRTSGGGAFSTLSPRQKLAPAPYAIYAANAGVAGTANAVAPGSVTGAGIAPGTITGGNIASGQVLRSLNGLTDAVTLAPGPNISMGVSGNNLFISTPGPAWLVSGNSGTSPTSGNFLGTTDNQPLELRANGVRAMRIEPNTNGAPNMIGGAPINYVDPGIVGATIGGGGTVSGNFFLGGGSNHVAAIFGTIAGGRVNSIFADHGFIGGGITNTVEPLAYDAVIGGGVGNLIETNAYDCVIGGGNFNMIQNDLSYAVISGGQGNTIQSNTYVPVIGGGGGNSIQAGAYAPAIGGGYFNAIGLGDNYTTIAGGGLNTVQTNARSSTISGGYGNTISSAAIRSTIGGGYVHSIGTNSHHSTISGGEANVILPSSDHSAIAGGLGNLVSSNAPSATVSGGTSNTVSGSYSSVGGGSSNFNAAAFAAIAGGAQNATATYGAYASVGGGQLNTNSGYASVIGGGQQNLVAYAADHSVVGGGGSNVIAGSSFDLAYDTIDGGYSNVLASEVIYASIGGGYMNRINNNASFSTIGGGSLNSVASFALSSTIGGGAGNSAFGYGTVVPGGIQNSAYGDNSFAAGNYAAANHKGAFVWSDASSNLTFSSTTSNQFAVRALGGVRFVTGGAGLTVDGEPAPIPLPTSNDANHSNIVNVLNGSSVNSIAPGTYGATISGGGAANYLGNAYPNASAADFSTIAGGGANTVQPSSTASSIGGGFHNVVGANASDSTIAGGYANSIGTNATGAAIAGGALNAVQPGATYAAIPGGYSNSAAGNFSFAAGNQAQANHDGAFVWADSQNATFASTAANQFLIRASGGVGINTNNPSGTGLTVAGAVKAASFQGDGSGLFNVSAGALGNYVFAYSAGILSVAAPTTFQDIPVSVDSQLSGWAHAPSTPWYTNAQTGLYLIQYTAGASAGNLTGTNVSMRATLNQIEIPGSQASAYTIFSPPIIIPISKSFIVAANAADVLTLQFTGSSTASRLIGSGYGATRPCVSLTITRIQ